MENYYFKNTKEIKKEKESLEKTLNVKISLKGRLVTVEGTPINEYDASRVMQALEFGFSAKKALLLLDEDIIFRRINIKDFTRKKNLKEVRGRIIGAEGKTKRTIENISNCDIEINENEIGIISSADEIEEVTTAITNLVRGTKQANIYSFLEKMNKEKKKYEMGL